MTRSEALYAIRAAQITLRAARLTKRPPPYNAARNQLRLAQAALAKFHPVNHSPSYIKITQIKADATS